MHISDKLLRGAFQRVRSDWSVYRLIVNEALTCVIGIVHPSADQLKISVCSSLALS